MFCPKCGTQVSDDVAFCPNCGAATKATAPADSFDHPVGKRTYYSKIAPKTVRLKRYIAMALGIVCVLMVFFSAYKAINGSIFDLPIFSLVDVADNGNEMQKELDKTLEMYEEYEDEDVINDFIDKYFESTLSDGVDLDKVVDLLNPLSLSSIAELAEMGGMDSKALEAFDLLITAFWVIAGFLMALAALGVIFQKGWLMVLSCIFGIPFIIFWSGTMYWFLLTALFIATAILFSGVKKSYKKYKKAYKK